MSKLGLGCYRAGGDVLEAIKESNAGIVLLADTALEMTGDIRSWNPNIIIVGRTYVPEDQQRIGRGLKEAYNLGIGFAANLPDVPEVDYWTSYCEISVQRDPERCKRLNKFELGFTDEIHRRGKKSCILNLSVGHLESEELKFFREAITAADAIGYHAYGGQTSQLMSYHQTFPWYSLRYRKDYQYLDGKPVILTESGTYDPWKGKIDESEIANDFLWLGDRMLEDLYVLGTTLYCCGTPDKERWSGFDILGSSIISKIGAWNLLHRSDGSVIIIPVEEEAPIVESEQPTEEPETESIEEEKSMGYKPHDVWDRYMRVFSDGYNPNTAIGKYREQHPDLGVAISKEQGHDPDTSPYVYQFFANGVVLWEKKTGRIFQASTIRELPLA